MVNRRELLKNVGVLSSATVLPFGDLLSDKPPTDFNTNDGLLPVLIQPNEGQKT